MDFCKSCPGNISLSSRSNVIVKLSEKGVCVRRESALWFFCYAFLHFRNTKNAYHNTMALWIFYIQNAPVDSKYC